MILFIAITLFITMSVFSFLQQAKFGRLPAGDRLLKMKELPNFKDGSFQNISPTPDLTEGVSYWQVIKEFFFDKKERITPTDSIPSVKTDLLNLKADQDILVWFGHSSYFIQLDGKRILVDPVFSGSATPLPFGTKAFKGTDIYTTEDLPEIDYLIITHDHWDHLDYETIKRLKAKVGLVICGLGVGAHFEYWGYDVTKVIEKNWNEKIVLDDDFILHTVSARHFSGRGFMRNKSLWLSFVLKTPSMQVFIGGDSGYDNHFAETGRKFGEFDLVILENGQYDKSWRYIHLLPDEVLMAAKDLKTKKLLAVHNSKFALGNHPWDKPMINIAKRCKTEGLKLLTPKIGEQVNLKDDHQLFTEWWKGLH